MNWQPFDTAPKDESDILLFWPAASNPRTNRDIISVGSICADGYAEVEGWTAGKLWEEWSTDPTHWMMLPSPPTSQPATDSAAPERPS